MQFVPTHAVVTGMLAIVMALGVAETVAAGEPTGASRTVPVRKKAPAQQYKISCETSPELCMTEPVARGCGDGRHWSAAGSNLAHCVEDDRDCKDGTPGKRDEYDNLVCADEKAAVAQAAAQERIEGESPVKN